MTHMHWVGLYPYRAALAAIVLLVLLGGALVVSKSSQSPLSTTQTTWGQVGSLVQQPGAGGTRTSDTVTRQVSDSDIYTSLTAGKTGKYGDVYANDIPVPQSPIITNTGDGFKGGEVETFLASVKPSAEGITTKNQDGEDLSLSDIYSYVPSNSIPFVKPTTSTRTPLQDSLYNYGNDAGSIVESHDERYPNVATVMDAFFKNRSDPTALKGVKGLAASLAQAGQEIAALETVPANVASLNASLALDYKDLATKLSALTESKSDTELVGAITTYNTSAEAFAKTNVGIATLFSAAGVHFSSTEAGRMFQFTPMN